jgi:hypothetical protein
MVVKKTKGRTTMAALEGVEKWSETMIRQLGGQMFNSKRATASGMRKAHQGFDKDERYQK